MYDTNIYRLSNPLKLLKMNRNNTTLDPTEWNEPEAQTCKLCSNYLTDEEVKQDDDFCDDCFYSCCGDELDQDIRICPTCKEHN